MPQLRLDIIRADSDVSGIDCGVPSIQEMIRQAYCTTIYKQALSYNISLDNVIIGSCSIRFGFFKDDEYYINDPEYCAIDISYLAIDKKFQKQTYGSYALNMLIKYAYTWSAKLPIRCLTLKALPGLSQWYKKCGFVEYPGEDDPRFPNCTPMMIDFMDRKSVDAYADSL